MEWTLEYPKTDANTVKWLSVKSPRKFSGKEKSFQRIVAVTIGYQFGRIKPQPLPHNTHKK
jgi:hypothetical protein